MPFCNTCRLQALSYLAAIINLSLIPQPRNYPSSTTTTPELTNHAKGPSVYTTRENATHIITKWPKAKLAQMEVAQKCARDKKRHGVPVIPFATRKRRGDFTILTLFWTIDVARWIRWRGKGKAL